MIKCYFKLSEELFGFIVEFSFKEANDSLDWDLPMENFTDTLLFILEYHLKLGNTHLQINVHMFEKNRKKIMVALVAK